MHVAIGVIINQQHDVFIAQRPADKYKGGLWEFPGGKVEPGETVLQALHRELQEEIGIQIISAEPWMQVTYDYEDRKVLLDTWIVTQFSGEPLGLEGQSICWAKPNMLRQFDFPEGNQSIIEKLQFFPIDLNVLKLI